MVRICVDAMGGDDAVELVLAGVEKALERDGELEVLLAGNEEVVAPFAEAHERAFPLVTTETIAMEEHPAEAVRSKRDSSIVRGCEAVKEGEAHGFFSAGSTGAVLAAATLRVGRIKGIGRPALAVALPGVGEHETVMLDLGANADCRPEMIVQFARMGTAFAQDVLGVENPKVGLLSNGSEDTKGSETVIGFHQALREAQDLNFAGNAEGTDILLGDFDVIVCDGFTGNVALKTLEGTAKYLLGTLTGAAKASEETMRALQGFAPVLKAVSSKISGDAYGGAVLLGLKAPVFIGHGHTSEEAVANGIAAAAKAARMDLCGQIAESIA